MKRKQQGGFILFARCILPKRLQKKNVSEIAAEKKAAAAIFNNMMSGDIDFAAKTLQNMPSNKRADIIANMDTLSATQITVFMKK